MRRAVGVVAAGLALAACAHTEPVQHATGGPVTPTPVPVTINPSAMPLGNTVPTGIVLAGHEMILYFWGDLHPYLSTVWRDTNSGRITDVPPIPRTVPGLPIGTAGVDPIFGLDQIDAGDGTVVEYGAVHGRPARIVVRDPSGTGSEASFTTWTRDPAVVIFWVQRKGSRIPENVAVREGVWEPLAPDRYPLVSAYDDGRRLIAEARIRPSGFEQKGG
jgi:hypothetical protein